MAYPVLCDGCKEGNHKLHKVVPYPAPEGVCGGGVCPCHGECELPLEKIENKFIRSIVERDRNG